MPKDLSGGDFATQYPDFSKQASFVVKMVQTNLTEIREAIEEGKPVPDPSETVLEPVEFTEAVLLSDFGAVRGDINISDWYSSLSFINLTQSDLTGL